jgi:hypothetical protein
VLRAWRPLFLRTMWYEAERNKHESRGSRPFVKSLGEQSSPWLVHSNKLTETASPTEDVHPLFHQKACADKLLVKRYGVRNDQETARHPISQDELLMVDCSPLLLTLPCPQHPSKCCSPVSPAFSHHGLHAFVPG